MSHPLSSCYHVGLKNKPQNKRQNILRFLFVDFDKLKTSQHKVRTMSIGPDELKKIATLSRLKLEEQDVEKLSQDINNILSLVDQLQKADTQNIEPMANPLDATQTLRQDIVTEHNQREAFQAVAPATEDGLYLVPKVIE
jgi:aspartyl-tRNA(Asn)/glutamyl-tRNA(Gln) amidotransferase subunit C